MDTFGAPEVNDIRTFLSDFGIGPVQIGLGHIKQMEIPLIKLLDIFPGAAGELGLPVVGRQSRSFAFAEDVLLLVFLISGHRLFEPFVFRGCMIEDHVEHDADAALCGFRA